MDNPLQRALKKTSANALFLDGGLATHLEALGHDIKDSLWSAKLLITNPSIITQAHYDYLKSGANIIITASYQASIKGFTSIPYDLTYTQAVNKMYESVTLAAKAIDKYCNEQSDHNPNMIHVIAASIGCYGAGLSDGSEYTGYYGENINELDLKRYHSVKMHATMRMRDTVANDIVLACETIPNLMEVKVLTELLNEYKYYGWITMACCNQYQLNSKELVSDAIDIILQNNNRHYVIGIGFNCTHPKYIKDLLIATKKKCIEYGNKDLLYIVYPNSGEEWDAQNKRWKPNTIMSDAQYALYALDWYLHGANVIGGCCRTTPNTIREVKKKIVRYQSKL